MKHIEIERKFLVKNNSFKLDAFKEEKIEQGFLSSVPERTVRIRLQQNIGFITVKGLGNASGLTRFEWENKITKEEAEALLQLCEPGLITKTRYFIKSNQHIFEVDEFYGDNNGLIIAEIELKSENEVFDKPDWLGEEVTGNIKYYNSYLANYPFKKW